MVEEINVYSIFKISMTSIQSRKTIHLRLILIGPIHGEKRTCSDGYLKCFSLLSFWSDYCSRNILRDITATDYFLLFFLVRCVASCQSGTTWVSSRLIWAPLTSLYSGWWSLLLSGGWMRRMTMQTTLSVSTAEHRATTTTHMCSTSKFNQN